MTVDCPECVVNSSAVEFRVSQEGVAKLKGEKTELVTKGYTKRMLQYLKDYVNWLLAVLAREVMIFMFNTGKG